MWHTHGVHSVHETSASVATSAPAPADTSEVVARLGATNLTANQIRAFVASLSAREKIALVRDPALLSQAVRILLANQLAFSEAVARKWDQQPVVAQRLQQIRNNAIAETYLQYVSAAPRGSRPMKTSRRFIEANKSAFLVPRQFCIAQIFVASVKASDPAVPEEGSRKARQCRGRAEEAGRRFCGPGRITFGRHSDWTARRRDRLDSRRPDQAGDQERGRRSSSQFGQRAIKMDDGWHIIKLLDTKAAYTRPLAEVRPALVQRIRTENVEARPPRLSRQIA